MTDNEIIKAYELCHSDVLCNETNCPFFAKCKTEDLSVYVLDLINRQKAEIERLKAEADMADSYDAIPDCNKCKHQTMRYDLIQIGSNFLGGYAIVQSEGKLEKVALGRVYDIQEKGV